MPRKLRTVLLLAPEARLEFTANGPRLHTATRALDLTSFPLDALTVLARLCKTADTQEALEAQHLCPPESLRHAIAWLDQRRCLRYRLEDSTTSLLTLCPISSVGFGESKAPRLTADMTIRLCRFALLRAEEQQWRLESPLATARVLIHPRGLAALLFDLAKPILVEKLLATSDLDSDLAWAGLELMVQHRLVVPDSSGPPSDSATELAWRSPFELMAHMRSRRGFDPQPLGQTYPFSGRLEPPIREPVPSPEWPLWRPSESHLEQDPPLSTVMQTRRSRRPPYGPPIHKDQLAELLFRTLRVQTETPSHHRPYPSAGGIYSFQTRVAIHRCVGLKPGLYHYVSEHHGFNGVHAHGPDLQALMTEAMHGVGAEVQPDVLILFTARMDQIAWVYGRLAYSLALKEAGAVFQTMYLAAEAMNLAVCAVGTGHVSRLADLCGADPRIEIPVGELMVGTRREPASEP